MRFIKKLCVLLVFVLTLGVFTGCFGQRSNEPVKHVTHSEDFSSIEKYFNLEGVDRVDYESIVFTLVRSVEIGPHEARFRGILYLTEDEAAKLLDKYEWEEVASPVIEFDEVDKSAIGEGPWYRSNQFDKESFKAISVTNCYFDGKKLVFDIHQT